MPIHVKAMEAHTLRSYKVRRDEKKKIKHFQKLFVNVIRYGSFNSLMKYITETFKRIILSHLHSA